MGFIEFRVWGLGFGVLGFMVLRFRVQGVEELTLSYHYLDFPNWFLVGNIGLWYIGII